MAQNTAMMNAEKNASQDRLDTEPVLKDLSNKVAPKVVAVIKPLALQLDLEDHDVAAIQLSHPFDPQGQALAVFSKWQNLDRNYTWRFLIESLRAPGVGLEKVARDLEKWLAENSTDIN